MFKFYSNQKELKRHWKCFTYPRNFIYFLAFESFSVQGEERQQFSNIFLELASEHFNILMDSKSKESTTEALVLSTSIARANACW